MEELIGRIVNNVGVDESLARNAVRIILSFLFQEGDRDKIAALVERIPDARTYIDDSETDSAATLGGLSGLMGGGVMEALGKLQAIGLGMGQIQAVTKETIVFAREKAGEDNVNDIIASIPGLSQFV